MIALVVACGGPAPVAQADTTNLVEARVPAAIAGDRGWAYQQRVTADLDGDGVDETAVLIADVALDARGIPMWEHGHRWQLYVQERDGVVTRVYARFLPNGKLTAQLAVADSGLPPTILLLEQTPHSVGVYEVRYAGPRQLRLLRHFDRRLDTKWFVGSPRP